MKMKFKDFVFPSNPSSLEIISSTNVQSKAIFDKSSRVENVSLKPVVIRGSGELYGDGAEECCSFLQHMLRLKSSGILFLPSSQCFNAYLTEFSFKRNADKSSISYSFTFTENCNDKSESTDFDYTVAREGENAFDIANRCNISVSTIMMKNDYKTPFDVMCGDRVVLR